jgi:hypothetical protein
VAEVLGWIAVVLIFSAFGAGTVIYASRLLRRPEPLALRSGDDATRTAYLLAKRSVRVLEKLVVRDDLVPFLSTAERDEIDAVIKEFNEY